MAKLFRAAIMGPPGSGKGTISKRIAQSFGLQYLSSGRYLRESIAANTGEDASDTVASTGRASQQLLLSLSVITVVVFVLLSVIRIIIQHTDEDETCACVHTSCAPASLFLWTVCVQNFLTPCYSSDSIMLWFVVLL